MVSAVAIGVHGEGCASVATRDEGIRTKRVFLGKDAEGDDEVMLVGLAEAAPRRRRVAE
jgi:hypothetical protein